MQLNKLAILSLLSSVAIAAPVVVTVTEVVVTTVIVEGETQSLNSAPVFTSEPSTTYTPTSIATTSSSIDTPIATTTSNDLPTTTLATSTTSNLITPATPTTTSVEQKAVEITSTSSTSTSTSTSSTSTSAAATTTSTSSDFESEILNEHNAKRSLHGVDALSWDETLATYAQNYADEYDCSGSLTHSGGPYGENLALGYTITGSVDAWYAEGDNYDYGSSCSVYDHFTQVVWKSTTKVGCGYKQCGSYWGTYIVCSYDPAGNYVGECDANVLPLV